MDYKYIEQLLERYWNCETSLEEEQILRTFFNQKEVPAHLARYQELFMFEKAQQDVSLGEDFDEKLLAAAGINEETSKENPRRIKAGKFTIAHRLRPLY
ncbi:MAG: pyruvate ferredoxin oxidoreductase, partial [Prevotellamassilia sp.]|nr:pyruvate ferredoxin oxidoreductase [Prevotellamassilia sp.]